MARFTLPRDIFYGEDAISELKVLKGKKRAIIVTGGGSMKRSGFLQKTEQVMHSIGVQTQLFEGVEPDPSIETVYRGAEAMRAFEPDIIIAIGGGSPIDAAKAMWVFYEYPDKTFDDIKDPFSLPPLRQKAIFVAIPSTSGTATEVTAFSVITDYSNNVKYPLADFEITPDIAILDTSIPLTMPQKLTADTGMDALTHSVEAYVATARSGFSDPLAMQAISDIFDSLVDSYHGCKQAREKMHIAQCLAGMAFSNALLGICHSLAHKVGAEFQITHGCCNAILLPLVIQFNSKVCMDRYAAIARYLNLPGMTDKQLVNSLVEEIRRMRNKVGILPTFADNGVTKEHLESKIDFICSQAEQDPCTASNPRPASAEDLKKVLLCAFHGEDVTF